MKLLIEIDLSSRLFEKPNDHPNYVGGIIRDGIEAVLMPGFAMLKKGTVRDEPTGLDFGTWEVVNR